MPRLIARVPLIEDGQMVERGQTIGRIRMGSQVDVWAPLSAQP